MSHLDEALGKIGNCSSESGPLESVALKGSLVNTQDCEISGQIIYALSILQVAVHDEWKSHSLW